MIVKTSRTSVSRSSSDLARSISISWCHQLLPAIPAHLTSHQHIKNSRSSMSTAIRPLKNGPLIVDLLHKTANTRKVQLSWCSPRGGLNGYRQVVSAAAAAAPWGNYTQGPHLSRMLWTASITFNTNTALLNTNKKSNIHHFVLSQLFNCQHFLQKWIWLFRPISRTRIWLYVSSAQPRCWMWWCSMAAQLGLGFEVCLKTLFTKLMFRSQTTEKTNKIKVHNVHLFY